MRVLFLSVYFPPEVGAPQARTYETARWFARWGHHVVVLTGFPNHPTGRIARGYRGRLFMQERVDGLDVRRTWLYPAPNRGLWRWAAKHFSFALSALLAAPLAGRFDAVVVESSALFLGLTAWIIGRLQGIPWVLTIGDLWPETAVAQGQLANPGLIKLTERLADFVYGRADMLVGVTQGICRAVIDKGVPPEKVAYIPNGTDTTLFHPGADGSALRRALGLEGKFVVMYAGTMGLAQGLEVVLEAAKLLRAEADVRFVLVGDGVEKPNLVGKARREGIDNVLFLERQPRSRMPAVLSAADLILVPLRRRPLFEGALPSKLPEAMACGKPVIVTIMGEAAALLEGAGAGLAVEPEQPRALAEAIARIRGEPALAREMGRRARAFAVEHLERSRLARRLEELLLGLIAERKGLSGAMSS